jgi:CheY-like chemotaxis protein
VILEQLTPEIINDAVDIYLQYAFDNDEQRKKHRVTFEETISPIDIIEKFESETDPSREDAHQSFVLRLGSADYPHMKLALWEAYYRGEYVFAVDCHDGFKFDSNNPDYQEWLLLKDKNRQRKLKIEEAWFVAGMPTIKRLKSTALSRTDCIREFRGLEILLVDDDADSSAIVSMILNANGFKCHQVRSVVEAKKYIENPDNTCGLAIVDIVLSDGSGMEVRSTLRAEPRTQDIPIIMSSALNAEEVQTQGIVNYLRKPFSAHELNHKIEAIIREQYDGHKVFLTRKKDFRQTLADNQAGAEV